MSSHHIVKEDQEPALIIVDTEGVTRPQLNQLLEWNPIVVTHHENAQSVIDKGIKVDVLITDKQLDLPQDHVLILPIDGTFLDTALTYLVGRGCKAANIISNDADVDVSLFRHIDIHVTVLGDGKRIFAVKSGFRKWKPQGEPVYVYTAVTHTLGLIRQGENHYITAKDGFYAIHFAEQYGLVGECL
ncbi:hypothetical protein JHJ32_00325 [Parapedobacter sp. ISTM3]|uniref:Thiamine pyrophosphokinase n=1 Tax=Parapedobacter luteus TaxID=623280 RepID=A0A1T5DDD7_9SPHI|nr:MULTISPECIES: hypothetical protein [Parapedobacter]MBK1438416.1 hypothetical protein [Parapedobacter sp. ISTM3]SKB69666.1 hypothetical protein SAMN05660226_02730 [Parapedobacter luteus]